jgi:hypothetical protein
LGETFNCTLHPIDSTGPTTPSRALEEIIRGLALTDTWSQDSQRPTFTHYSPTGATRIDRIYLTKAYINRKIATEIIPTAFTDHNAVVLRLTTPAQEMMKMRGRWKMDPNLAQDENIRTKIKLEWAKWRKHKGFYPDILAWWKRKVKPHIQRLEQHNIMENHLYQCLYDIMQRTGRDTEKFYDLQRYKAKIVNLNAKRRAKILLDTLAKVKMEDEDPSLYHVLQQRRLREIREIKEIQDAEGTTHTRMQDIRNSFVQHMASKFSPIAVDEKEIKVLLTYIPPVNPTTYAAQLERPITADEVHWAMRAGVRHKAPGIDWLSLEFCTANWDTIKTDLTELLNHMFLQNHIPPRQKQGILICLPKSQESRSPDDFRPISLLNTEYKILTRFLANRLRQILAEQITSSQYCGVPGKSILDALAYIRDIPSHYENKGKPLCLMTLDFNL